MTGIISGQTFLFGGGVFLSKREEVHQQIGGNETIFGFNLDSYNIKNKRQILRNMVNPEIGLHILDSARNIIRAKNVIQKTIFDL